MGTLVTLNSRIGKARMVVEGGVTYFVAPLTSIVPGVLNGSKGALYYPPAEISANYKQWDGTPLTVGHPYDSLGNPISAGHPEAQRQVIGEARNTLYKGKLTHEGWFDAARTLKVNRTVYDNLRNGVPMELSTGLYTDNEQAPPNSTCPRTGRPFDFVARNYRRDHIAILPNEVGACSLNDGCGVLINKDAEVKTTPKGKGWVKESTASQATGKEALAKVLSQLSTDYEPHTLAWMHDVPWRGPLEVPLDQIDYSGRKSWRAHHEPKKVEKFAGRIEGGKMKPIVAVKTPGDAKLKVLDGHHRALAYRKLGRPAMVYVGTVPSDSGPWDELHASQVREGSLPKKSVKEERAVSNSRHLVFNSVFPDYVINPFVSEAQRRACYAKDDPGWDCSEWEEHTPDKKLPKKKAAAKPQRSSTENEAENDFVSEAQRRFMWSQHPDIAESWAHGEHTADSNHKMPDEPGEDVAMGGKKDKKGKKLTKNKAWKQFKKMVKNGAFSGHGYNPAAPQPRHPSNGTWQGKSDKAARRGYAQTPGGHEQAPEDDADDDGDNHPAIGQGDRSPDSLLSGKSHTTDATHGDHTDAVGVGRPGIPSNNEDSMTTRNFGFGPPGGMANPTGGPNAPHDATKQAASASLHMEHDGAFGHAQKALAASKDGRSDDAAKHHERAADAHFGAAVDAHKDKDPAAADQHLQAAAFHQQAGAMHAGMANNQLVDNDHEGHYFGDKNLIGAGDSDAAATASRSANRKGTAEGHRAAAKAHRDAAAVHKSAGHADRAAHHLAAAKKHSEKAKVTGNSEGKTVKIVVNKLNRERALKFLTANCGCEKERAALNNLNNDTLTILVNAKTGGSNSDDVGAPGILQAGGQHSDDEDEEDKTPGGALSAGDVPGKKVDVQGDQDDNEERMSKMTGGQSSDSSRVGNAEAAWYAKAPAPIRNAYVQRKQAMVSRLVAYVANRERRQQLAANLMKESEAQLAERLEMVGPAQVAPAFNTFYQQPPATQFEEQVANYLGAGGGFDGTVTNSGGGDDDDILPLPTMNYAEMATPGKNGQHLAKTE